MKSSKGKGSYLTYQAENRAEKNKIRKLERHCKKYPKDEIGAKNLARIKKDGYKPRTRPLIPGSNQQVFMLPRLSSPPHIDTPGEQLSKLLGIPMPKLVKPKRKKPSITHKQKRNVKRT